MSDLATPDAVLEFWFGPLDEHGSADAVHSQRWFTKDAAFDAEIRRRFGALHAAIAAGEQADWLASAREALAHVIVLDQFSRNLFRDSGQAFATDARALVAAELALDRGDARELLLAERMFLYMPLMHAENLATQQRCVELFRELAARAPEALRAQLDGATKFAERHLEIIERFGRFPHRNAALGRETTEAELEFLKQPGSSF
jgi:uncharacterized protein (DUF924 family)